MDSREKIYAYLAEEFDLSNNDISDMLDEFQANTSVIIQKITRAVDYDCWKSLGDESHSLKGASANIGASSLASLCKKLEAAAMSKNKEQCKEFVKEIIFSLNSLFD